MVARPGPERGRLARFVGPVRGLQGMLRGGAEPPGGGERLGEPEMQLGMAHRLQVGAPVIQRVARRPFRRLHVAEMCRDPGEPGVVLDGEPRQPRRHEPVDGAPEESGGRFGVVGTGRELPEHRVRLGGPRREAHVVPGVRLREGQQLPRGLVGGDHDSGLGAGAGSGVAVGGRLPAHRAGLQFVHPVHQRPGPAHQHGRRLRDPRPTLREQGEYLRAQIRDDLQGLRGPARQRLDVRGAGNGPPAPHPGRPPRRTARRPGGRARRPAARGPSPRDRRSPRGRGPPAPGPRRRARPPPTPRPRPGPAAPRAAGPRRAARPGPARRPRPPPEARAPAPTDGNRSVPGPPSERPAAAGRRAPAGPCARGPAHRRTTCRCARRTARPARAPPRARARRVPPPSTPAPRAREPAARRARGRSACPWRAPRPT